MRGFEGFLFAVLLPALFLGFSDLRFLSPDGLPKGQSMAGRLSAIGRTSAQEAVQVGRFTAKVIEPPHQAKNRAR